MSLKTPLLSETEGRETPSLSPSLHPISSNSPSLSSIHHPSSPSPISPSMNSTDSPTATYSSIGRNYPNTKLKNYRNNISPNNTSSSSDSTSPPSLKSFPSSSPSPPAIPCFPSFTPQCFSSPSLSKVVSSAFFICFLLECGTFLISFFISPDCLDPSSSPFQDLNHSHSDVTNLPFLLVQTIESLIMFIFVLFSSAILLMSLRLRHVKPLELVSLYLSTITLFGSIYRTIFSFDFSSFQVNPLPADPSSHPKGLFEFYVLFHYFSTSTMTSAGLGDISPIRFDAKLFCSIQQFASLLYTTLIFGIGIDHLRLSLVDQEELAKEKEKEKVKEIKEKEKEKESKGRENPNNNIPNKKKMDKSGNTTPALTPSASMSNALTNNNDQLSPLSDDLILPDFDDDDCADLDSHSFCSTLYDSLTVKLRSFRSSFPRFNALRRFILRHIFLFLCFIQFGFLLCLLAFDQESITSHSPTVILLIIIVQLLQFLLIIFVSLKLIRAIHRHHIQVGFLFQSYTATIILFGSVYFIIYLIGGEESFSIAHTKTNPITILPILGNLFWFSLTTMTTLGIGDVIPLHYAARLFVMAQLIISVFFHVVILGMGMAHTGKHLNWVSKRDKEREKEKFKERERRKWDIYYQQKREKYQNNHQNNSHFMERESDTDQHWIMSDKDILLPKADSKTQNDKYLNNNNNSTYERTISSSSPILINNPHNSSSSSSTSSSFPFAPPQISSNIPMKGNREIRSSDSQIPSNVKTQSDYPLSSSPSLPSSSFRPPNSLP